MLRDPSAADEPRRRFVGRPVRSEYGHHQTGQAHLRAASKNGENTTTRRPGAPHLLHHQADAARASYRSKVKVTDVHDQFDSSSSPQEAGPPVGTDAKSLTGPPPPLQDPLDHFKCYRVSRARFRSPGITVETQFGPLTVDIKKPLHLCAPVNKNGEDPSAPGHPDHLMCYLVRGPRPLQQTIFTNNQFGDGQLRILRPARALRAVDQDAAIGTAARVRRAAIIARRHRRPARTGGSPDATSDGKRNRLPLPHRVEPRVGTSRATGRSPLIRDLGACTGARGPAAERIGLSCPAWGLTLDGVDSKNRVQSR